MKIIEILTEKFPIGHRAPLYHSMTFQKAEDVFSNDTLRSKLAHWFGDKQIAGTSLSRNKHLGYQKDPHFGSVQLALNTDLLIRDGYKILPLDAEMANDYSIKKDRELYGHSYVNKNPKPDRQIRPNPFSEEYIIGEVSQLSKYLLEINLMTKPSQWQYNFFRDYAKKHNIKLKIAKF